jgi:hypothetical protein
MVNLGQSISYGNEKLKTKWVNWTKPGTYTWQVPAGMYWIKGYIVGAGGGGGGGSSSYTGGAGGSGATIVFQSPVTPGESLSIYVGAGGAGGTGGSSPTTGTVGQTSYINFSDNTILSAGGAGGGGAGTSSAGGSGGSGGGWAVNNLRGMLISTYAGNTGSSGTSSSPPGGAYANYPNAYFTGNNQNGGAGRGGSAGGLNTNGGNGQNGIVIIWWEKWIILSKIFKYFHLIFRQVITNETKDKL